MPLISIPKTEVELEQEQIAPNTTPFSDIEMLEYIYKRIRAYANTPNWKCPECGSINFGRNKSCPYCRERLRKTTNRPPGMGCEEKPQWK